MTVTTIRKNNLEINNVHFYSRFPRTPMDYINNLSFKLDKSSAKNNQFDRELKHLIRNGVIRKAYDYTDHGYREALYMFKGKQYGLSFHGINHKGLHLFLEF